MTELDGIHLNIIWIHQKCRHHTFTKALTWWIVSLESKDVFKCIDCSLTYWGKSKLTTFQRVKSHPRAVMSPGNLLEGVLSSTGANVPSFFSHMCLCVNVIWLMSCWFWTFKAPYFLDDWCFFCSCQTQHLHAVIVCSLHSFKLVQFLENCCEWLLFGGIFPATVDRSSLRWCTLGGPSARV